MDPEVAGALARFWAGGDGPSHTTLSAAFARAGYVETEPADQWPNKEERVRRAVLQADGSRGRRVVEELLGLMRSRDYFDGPRSPHGASQAAALRGLCAAFDRKGHALSADGFVEWGQDAAGTIPSDSGAASPAALRSPRPGTQRASSEPSAQLLEGVLRRLPEAIRVLQRRRRGEPLIVRDEYDVQDVVEALLRAVYRDVRVEEPGPSRAGSSSRADLSVPEIRTAVEVKVTRPGRGELQIKTELLRDFEDFRAHPDADRIVVIVLDAAGTFRNPEGFEKDLSRRREGVDTVVMVVRATLEGLSSDPPM